MGMKGLGMRCCSCKPLPAGHSPTVGMNSKQVRISRRAQIQIVTTRCPDANLSDTWNCGLLVESHPLAIEARVGWTIEAPASPINGVHTL